MKQPWPIIMCCHNISLDGMRKNNKRLRIADKRTQNQTRGLWNTEHDF
jgi:hypothetical protein